MQKVEIQQDEAVIELLAERTQSSFHNFFIYFWSTVCPEAYVPNFHHRIICDELEEVGKRIIRRQPKTHDLLLNLPPGESKSSIVSQLWPVWLWVNDPTIRVISGSYTVSLSIASALKSKDCIESFKFQQLFGKEIQLRRDMDAKGHYGNTAGGERLAVSVGSTATGHHAHAIILDDILDPSGAYSEQTRETTNAWMSRTISSRKVDERITPTVFISQRLHEADASANFEQIHKNVRKIVLPASDDYPIIPSYLAEHYVDGLLNPVRKPRSVLEERLKSLGSRDFAGQYGQAPAPADGSIFKKSWFQWYKKSELKIHQVDFYCDPAFTSDSKNDPSAILAYLKRGSDIFLINCKSVHLEFPELIKFLKSWTAANGYTNQSRIFIEPKASGKSLVQQLRRESELNVVEDAAPTDSKIVRAHAVTSIIEAGRVYLPLNESWTDSFLHQCITFPGGRHDDEVDCLTGALRLSTEEKAWSPWDGMTYGNYNYF